MATLPTNFQFLANTIRVVEIDGEPWFLASDVFIALGYASNSRTYQLSLLAEDEKGVVRIQTPGGRQNVKTLSESGLYKLTMRSDKPSAQKFQDWVTRVVLPAIRKDGMYVAGEEKVATGEMSREQLLAKASKVADEVLAEMEAKNKAMLVETSEENLT